MNLTPRLPVHGIYQPSPFTEQRYIRFGVYSLPVGLLFRLVELSLSPPFHHIRTSLLQIHSNPLISLCLDPVFDRKYLEIAWNCDISLIISTVEGYGLGNMSMDEVCTAWKERFGVQVLQYTGNCDRETAGFLPIYWDYVNTTEITLLYPHYHPSSFTLTPCGHIVLTSDLYAKMRKSMEMPRSKREMEGFKVECGCKRDIAQFGFDLAVEKANFGNWEVIQSLQFALQTGQNTSLFHHLPSSGCQICSKSDPILSICPNNCPICLPCLTISSLTCLGMTCPGCGMRVKEGVMEGIVILQGRIVGVKTSLIGRTYCQKCRIFKPISEFQVLKDHNCWICDCCLLDFPVIFDEIYSICPFCTSEISPNQLKLIFKHQKQTEKTVFCCILCHKNKEISDFFYKMSDKHACDVCDLCYERRIIPLQRCLICNKIPNPFFSNEKLSFKCQKCTEIRQSREFSCYFFTSHDCKICDFCISSCHLACQVCFSPFIHSDFMTISSKFFDANRKNRPCPCGNVVFGGKFMCKSHCFCSVCHLKRFITRNIRICVKCNGEIREFGEDFRVKCANCGLRRKGHMGICEKTGCVLCRYCVKVEGRRKICRVCEGEVEGLEVETIQQAQNELFLACYCEDLSNPHISSLPCGHSAHSDCIPTLPKCRLCSFSLLTLANHPETSTIWRLVLA